MALDAVTVEATGSHDKLDALVKVLQQHGIKELVQSGTIAVGRGGRSITDRALQPLARSALTHNQNSHIERTRGFAIALH